MKVILKADIKGVGKKDQVINASDGYARNFLFPKNLAVEANAENMSKLKGMQDSKAFKKSQEKEEAERIADKLSKILLKILQTFVRVLLTKTNSNAIIKIQVARLEGLCTIYFNHLSVQSYCTCWARKTTMVRLSLSFLNCPFCH